MNVSPTFFGCPWDEIFNCFPTGIIDQFHPLERRANNEFTESITGNVRLRRFPPDTIYDLIQGVQNKQELMDLVNPTKEGRGDESRRYYHVRIWLEIYFYFSCSQANGRSLRRDR